RARTAVGRVIRAREPVRTMVPGPGPEPERVLGRAPAPVRAGPERGPAPAGPVRRSGSRPRPGGTRYATSLSGGRAHVRPREARPPGPPPRPAGAHRRGRRPHRAGPGPEGIRPPRRRAEGQA